MNSENLEKENYPNSIILNDRDFKDFFTKSERIMLLIDPKGLQIVDVSESAQSFYGYDLSTFRKLNLTHLNPLPLEELKRCSGTQFDPNIINACEKHCWTIKV
jgi:hypothetical protein